MPAEACLVVVEVAFAVIGLSMNVLVMPSCQCLEVVSAFLFTA